jgi:hypothetical protein
LPARPGALRTALRAAALVTAVSAALGCATVDEDAVTTVDCPVADSTNFRPVSAVLEQRCGTLDCHGDAARPLRIYGQIGLRRPEPRDSKNLNPGEYEKYYSGDTAIATTQAELNDNAAAVCGLEPELLQKLRDGSETDPGTLTFIRKARLEEKHKGGRIWSAGETPDQCMINWLTGHPTPEKPIDIAPCKDPLSIPP